MSINNFKSIQIKLQRWRINFLGIFSTILLSKKLSGIKSLHNKKNKEKKRHAEGEKPSMMSLINLKIKKPNKS